MESIKSLVDTHCHLDADEYPDAEAILRRAEGAGVKGVVAVGSSLASSRAVLHLGQRFSGMVLPAAGLHPELEDWEEGEPEAVIDFIKASRGELVGIGEVGLPYYSMKDETLDKRVEAARREWFERFADLAAELEMPLLLHAPHSAGAEALSIIRERGIKRAVFHWHKAPLEITEEIVRAGYYISVTPEVCYRERDRELVRAVPIESLLLETDGPWPFEGEFAGKRTEPMFVIRLAHEVAALKGLTFEEVAERTTANAWRLLGREGG